MKIDVVKLLSYQNELPTILIEIQKHLQTISSVAQTAAKEIERLRKENSRLRKLLKQKDSEQ